jgi:hypothetical protein
MRPVLRIFRHGSLCCLAGGAVTLGLLVTPLAGATPIRPHLEGKFAFTVPPTDHKAPSSTSAQAVAQLNAQREANGIPGGLVENARLDEGCASHVDSYVATRTQYPHTELPTQPGYTPLGAEAASMSDLAGEFTMPVTERAHSGDYLEGGDWWGPEIMPWTEAPLHEAALFDPTSTTSWYAQDGSLACMGTSGGRAFVAPQFFSFPGTGAARVPTIEYSNEEPFTPAMAAGYKDGAKTGPTIILWAEGAPATIKHVTLTGPAGEVHTALVTPTTPAPSPDTSTFPVEATVGGTASYVIPSVLKAGTSYQLAVEWSSSAGASMQTIHFTTATSAGTIEERWRHEVVPSEAKVTATWHRPVLTIVPSGAAIGQAVRVKITACRWVYAWGDGTDECWSRGGGTQLDQSVRLGSHPLRLRLPHLGASEPLTLNLTLPRFKAQGSTGVTFSFAGNGIGGPLGPLPPNSATLPREP